MSYAYPIQTGLSVENNHDSGGYTAFLNTDSPESLRYSLLSSPNLAERCVPLNVNVPLNEMYLMRNARIASLHSSISMGKGPWHYKDPLVSEVLLESAKLHGRLQHYIHSSAIKFYRDGYPHTMTPLPIAFPDDPA